MTTTDVRKIERVVDSVMDMCFKNLDAIRFAAALGHFRAFWASINAHIIGEKPKIGGEIEVDEAWYCNNATQPGRIDTFM